MIKFLHRSEEALLCLLLASLTILGCCDAIFRQTGTTALWMEEALKWNAAWFVLFGASFGVRTGSHIGLTVLTDRISHPNIKKIIGLIAVAVCIAYTAIFLTSSWEYVQRQYKIGFDIVDIPVKQWIPYTGLLVGFALLFWRFLVLGINILLGRTSGFAYADEAKESVEHLAQPNSTEQQV
ncbi:TRAP transporter small permease [Suttonella sp. R2A3]|uniref:TRAP transporter small permease n=1 Tax=Suttonella sp. R2A3 TaxID=2908648 RepID=UPI001F3A5E6F|nr:TRAP transporter small permease [Suttonella sp. R2A3]UJF24892.1 TRAP transporter small permease [Suttonella sp. R2A3]